MNNAKAQSQIQASWHILKYYPAYKQSNILDLAQGYTESDRATFRAFRDAVRTRCHEYEAQIDGGQTPSIDYSDIVP